MSVSFPPLFTVSKYRIPDFMSEGRLVSVYGTLYRFPLCLCDARSLPFLSWTSICVGDVFTEAEPWVWRTAIKRPDLCVEVENLSDSNCLSLQQEARNCWQTFVNSVKKSMHWMNRIGVHPDIQQRMAEPYQHRWIEVRTLHDDYLAKMFAVGTAEVARAASLLHDVESRMSNVVERNQTLENFLWPSKNQAIPEWALARYDRALAIGYRYIDSTFAPPDQDHPLNSK